MNSSLLIFLISKISRKGRVLLYSSSYVNFIEGSTLFSLSVMLCKSRSCSFNYIYEVHSISFQTIFVWALLLIVHTWNSSPLRSNLFQLQCTCSTVPTTSRRPNGSPLVWECQWPSSEPLSSPQLSHNDSLWA